MARARVPPAVAARQREMTPSAEVVLLAVAAILALLAWRGYRREGRLMAQQKTWLTVAGIFVLIIVLLRASGS